MQLIWKYFPSLSEKQYLRLARLLELYPEWNGQINVISRKDIEHLEERHILHSMGIAKLISFKAGTRVLDAGTGGGLPGIPLAVLFPETEFVLVDSIGKKIKVAQAISSALGLDNVTALNCKYEGLQKSFDFITGRAVTGIAGFSGSLKKLIKKGGSNSLENGFLYLKGGDFEEDLELIRAKWKVYPLSAYFTEEFYATKKVLHLYRFI